jgi:3-hydroxyacyl-CoA dehydrogenase/enoyl-CoA hydratase/3-hydroxybutyryl-CoA epimerase/3-hydroxyacyl-CoA dehydrogenase/enoyl-CoA hydratase/3-hydroxybutyryl-CoA epimerase/enoyl-CoA isomerase
MAFPDRLTPSPLVPALLKRKRTGRAVGAGLYDYDDGTRSPDLAPVVYELIETNSVDDRQFSDGEVLQLLSIPMWIEATKLLDQGIAESMDVVDLAIAGGLGYTSDLQFSGFFAEMGQSAIQDAVARWKDDFRSMDAGS